MENWQIIYRQVSQRQCDAIAAATRVRLIRAARAGQERTSWTIHWYDRLLNRLGIALEGIGCRLQTRYARLTFHSSPCQPIERELSF